LIVEPELALAPVILPVMVPIVHANELGMLDVKLIFGPVPLQVPTVDEFVTAGAGLTVTVMVYREPVHEPPVEVGVTIYCTEPAVVLLGFVNTSLMVEPEPLLAPVILPVMVPIVQLNVLAALAVKLMLGLVPLQVLAVAEVVTAGFGLTVTVIVYADPVHPDVDVGVTIY